MVEGGVVKADKAEFAECWMTLWTTPYIMRLAASAGIGGLLFGYDTGVISGALLYIKEDFPEVERSNLLQSTIVSMAIAGAIVGAAVGGWMNDAFGRKLSMICADFVFFLGAIVMAFAPAPWVLIIGRVLVGLGVGMASMTSPLYISEASPHNIRGALVGTNNLMITGGQFLSYALNLAFTQLPHTWRWMLGIAGVPALLQLVLMCTLPESPRWLYRKNKTVEARAILERLYPADDVDKEMKALEQSIREEIEAEGSIGDSLASKMKSAMSNKVFRRGLAAGILCQVTQQLVGINTIMYYSPTIIQFAGIASKKTALALSLITSGINAAGSILNTFVVDRFGRRRLMIISMVGIIISLMGTAAIFELADRNAPAIDTYDSRNFLGSNSTCPAFSSGNCMSCLKIHCGFCANGENHYAPGACVENNKAVQEGCKAKNRLFFESGCPSKYGIYAVALLATYIITYAPGMGCVPWIINSEIYPLRYRGLGGGIAATCLWTANLIVSESFLPLVKLIGTGGTFLMFAAFGVLGLIGMYFVVPETKGKTFTQIERMLEKGYKPKVFRPKGDKY